MKQKSLAYNVIYMNNSHKTYKLTSIDIERFISMEIFPISIIPPIAVVFLKEKHAEVLHYLSDYILYNYKSSEEHPLSKRELLDVINKTLIDTGINIHELQQYNNAELKDWYNSQKNGLHPNSNPNDGRKNR